MNQARYMARTTRPDAECYTDSTHFKAYQLACEHILRKCGSTMTVSDFKRVMGSEFNARWFYDVVDLSHHFEQFQKGCMTHYRWVEKIDRQPDTYDDFTRTIFPEWRRNEQA